MIIIACTCLTLCHPGIAFQGNWKDADFVLRRKKGGLVMDLDSVREKEVEGIESVGES